jgi:hypothetical protein
VSLAAIAGALGKIVDAPVSWRITAAEGDVVYEGGSRALGLTLPVGDYRAEAFATNAKGELSFTVEADAENAFQVDVLAGRLDLSLVANEKTPPFSDQEAGDVVWTLVALDGQPSARIPSLARQSLLLAPGSYRVRATLQGMQAEGTADIAPGRPFALALNFKLGTAILEAALSEDGDPLDDAMRLAWRVGNRPLPSGARPRVTLPEGTYPVTLTIAGTEFPSKATIVAGEERVSRLVLKGGDVSLAARLGPTSPPLDEWRDTTWTIDAMAAVGVAPGTRAAQLPQSQPTLTLMPGRWLVGVDSGVVHAEREIVVAPEEHQAVTVDLDAARLTVRATPASGEPPANIVFSFYALDESGTPAKEPAYDAGSSEWMSIIVPAGRWRIRTLDSEGRTAEADLEAAAGEEKTVELTLR